MNANLLTPSKYLKAIEFKGREFPLTITKVEMEKLEKDDGTSEVKGTVSFSETPKKWIVNVTNVRCLIQLFGLETDDWIGKQVTLFPEANEQSETGVAIRVRGSPHLRADKSFTLKLARKRPRQVLLKKTAPRKGTNPQPIEPAQLPARQATVSAESSQEEDADVQSAGDDFEAGFTQKEAP